ncbi:hypothetical protein BX667DRAFT_515664 [Coemansia mojavensis]|nr:hypothetical protein BX667DRAFT_515664 [Coemansia mojavensis]
MKNKNRKRKFVVNLSDSEDERPAKPKDSTSSDIRITTHGKIRAYVQFINSKLSQKPKDPLKLFAEDTAICKLTTVLEIVKRSEHTGLSISISIGDQSNNPRKQTQVSSQTDTKQPARCVARGLYQKKQAREPPRTPNKSAEPADGPSGDVWMQALLTIAN